MLKILTLAAALMSLGALPVQALPAGPVQAGVTETDVTLVAGGCGRGFYRDAYGRCRRAGGPPVVVAPVPLVVAPPVIVAPRVVAPRACPRGMRYYRGACVYY